ncbi:hypothetical protein [Prevotella koreensis]|uniref:hypothetical protein n=1 Tax=Prevotella koreensis TaxID=2490854 RepID=UPI0028ECC83D|nr:hypothetical protein [Prevotella koreensis]
MVRKKWLIVANGLLWMAAGMNIGNIGIKSIMVAHSLVWLLSIPVFAIFVSMFIKIISKNINRIVSMQGEKAKLYKFLTPKGYMIIAFMMTLGITLRELGKIPESFFAYFYTGLGIALFFSGLWSFIILISRKLY